MLFALVMAASGVVFGQNNIASIPVPTGYQRVPVAANSYAEYLQQLPLKPSHSIDLWNGDVLSDDAYEILAVVDVPLLFKQDLEQCADFAMRFWAEYLNHNDALSELSLYDFNGRKKSFTTSQKTFREYLKWHMAYSNSYSIKRGGAKVHMLSELESGDMIVQNNGQGGIGHVSVVVDEAASDSGLKVFLVGYSYMPAQQFHIEQASDEFGASGWFTAEGYMRYAQRVFGTFGKPVIRRFERVRAD
ncbi:uncharacterized protein DUF4846 [Arenicella xantha]|uniref:Uncharacterized protein DUF4846 n=1 Tax=Arenicella xantha TaxID=644221 RepID=A0A395JM60_9GAMM|nr:uncharacterized protein DUF4846 [Arenicella xantha]